MLNYHRERFGKLTFRALALRQSELFLGYSSFELVYFFQTRSICLNLAQFVSP